MIDPIAKVILITGRLAFFAPWRLIKTFLAMGLENIWASPEPVSYYTSDAADEGLGVDLGGRRIIKKKITSLPPFTIKSIIQQQHYLHPHLIPLPITH